MSTNCTRRNVVAATAAAGAGLAVAALQGTRAAMANEPSPLELETRYEAELLIIGGGLAGFSAGIKALQLGATNVLIIDKATGEGADYGGSSLWSGGNFLYPAEGAEDAVAQYMDVVWGSSHQKAREDLITAMATRAYNNLNWLIDLGVEYGDPTNTYPQYPLILTRKMVPGQAMAALAEAYANLGGQVAYGVKACDFLLGNGGVTGVLACDLEGSYFNVLGGKTILCTGGYVANKARMEEYLGEEGDELFCRAPQGITGDGIRMVENAGGYMVNCHGLKTAYICGVHYPSGTQPFDLAYMVAINSEGKRFFDEATGAHSQEHGRKLLNEPGQIDGLIADSKVFANFESTVTRWEKKGITVYQTNTIEEMAQIFGCPVDAMVATINEYNEHVVGDHTEGLAIEKTGTAATIDTPPYYGFYPCKPGCSHAFGGIAINGKAQVLQPDGRTIANLYAAGEVAGGFFYDNYLGGTCTSRGSIIGELAAESALGLLD